MDAAAKVIEKLFLKLAPIPAILIAAVSAIYLFAYDIKRLERMHLKTFRDAYEGWLSLAFVVSIVIVALNALFWGYGISAAALERRRRLREFTPREKENLGGYLTKRTRTIELGTYDASVVELVQSGWISKVDGVQSMSPGASPYRIKEWAWNLLHHYPERVLSGEPLESFLAKQKVSPIQRALKYLYGYW